MNNSTIAADGWIRRQWIRAFGRRDPLEAQLRELATQGATMARFAHLCAGVMLILFSAGSLIGVASASTTALLAAWQNGRLDVIQAISTSVSVALVLCMDTAAIYAALMLRILSARGARFGERWHHWAIIAIADVLEAASFAYMSYLYDLPNTWIVWTLIVVRALFAPIFALYLSLARPLPVGARDMLHMAEMESGRGLIMDVTLEASNRHVPIARKAEIFRAASRMAPDDRSRLDDMIAVLNGGLYVTHMPPTDGGSPSGMRRPMESDRDLVGVTILEEPHSGNGNGANGSRPRATASSKPRKRSTAARSHRDSRTDAEIAAAIQDYIAGEVARGRDIPSNGRIARATGVSTSTASVHRRIAEAEAEAEHRAPILALPIAR